MSKKTVRDAAASKKKGKIGILILCAGGSGPIYLAKKLRKMYRVVLADASAQHAGTSLGLPSYRIPMGTDPGFLRAIRTIVRAHDIDYVVPGADEELVPLSAFAEKDTRLKVVAPRHDFIALCLNKKKLMHELVGKNISHVPPYEKIRDVRYPAIAKPISNHGSREVHRVGSVAQLNGYLALYGKKFGDILVQQLVSGDEYTVSVIVNNKNKLVGIVPKKIILKRGITRSAITASHPAIERACRAIVETMSPCGPFNVQLMLHKNAVYIFEINPRLSTTSVLTERAFGNEIELYVRYFDRETIVGAPKFKRDILLMRYEENIFS